MMPQRVRLQYEAAIQHPNSVSTFLCVFVLFFFFFYRVPDTSLKGYENFTVGLVEAEQYTVYSFPLFLILELNSSFDWTSFPLFFAV